MRNKFTNLRRLDIEIKKEIFIDIYIYLKIRPFCVLRTTKE